MADVIFPPQSNPGSSAPFEYVAGELWIEIPAALETVIYDARIPQGVLSHDHGDRRGDLIETPVYNAMMGPQAASGSAVGSWGQGVPLFPPASSQSFVTDPKLIYFQPVTLVGGSSGLHVELIFDMQSAFATRSVTLTACLRPFSDHGMKPGTGSALELTITHTDTSSPATESRNAFRFDDLSALGDMGLTKTDLILEIWLVANPIVTSLYRLLHVMPIWFTADAGSSNNEPPEWSGQRVTVEPASVRAGMIVESSTAQAGHTKHNQVTVEALGNAPGLTPNLTTVDERDTYLRYIRRRHRHHGRRFVDPQYDELKNDGAVIRSTLWSQGYLWNYGDAAGEMNVNPAEGSALHPNGTLNTAQGWLEAEGRLEVPIGLRAFDLRFGVAPRHSEQICRLWLYIEVIDPLTTSLDFTVGLGTAIAGSSKSGTFTKVMVDPRNGRAWQSNATRKAAGLGLWTSQAAKTPSPVGAGGAGRLTRISRDVRILLSNPLTRTGGLILRLAFELETGALGSGVRSTAATLSFIDVVTPAGF